MVAYRDPRGAIPADAKQRKAMELRAMKLVTADYQSLGATVKESAPTTPTTSTSTSTATAARSR